MEGLSIEMMRGQVITFARGPMYSCLIPTGLLRMSSTSGSTIVPRASYRNCQSELSQLPVCHFRRCNFSWETPAVRGTRLVAMGWHKRPIQRCSHLIGALLVQRGALRVTLLYG